MHALLTPGCGSWRAPRKREVACSVGLGFFPLMCVVCESRGFAGVGGGSFVPGDRTRIPGDHIIFVDMSVVCRAIQ